MDATLDAATKAMKPDLKVKPDDKLPEYVSCGVYGDEFQVNIPLVSAFQMLLKECPAEDIVEQVGQVPDIFRLFMDRAIEWSHTLDIEDREKLQRGLGEVLFEKQLKSLAHAIMNLERAASVRFDAHGWAQNIAEAYQLDEHERVKSMAVNLARETRPQYWGPAEAQISTGRIWQEAEPHWREWMRSQLRPAWAPTHVHTKSGKLVRLLHCGAIEANLDQVAIYEEADGAVWVRPWAEFNDGRFVSTGSEVVHAPAPTDIA